MSNINKNKENKPNNSGNLFKFLFFSAIGILMFFIPITIGETSTIMLDHIVTGIRNAAPGIVPYYALIIIILGGILPFKNKTWNKTKVDIVFSIFKIVGIFVAFMALFGFGPEALQAPSMIPFLWGKLVIPVGLIVPVGAIFLAFLVSYGLLEFIGIIMEPVMKPIWKTPGRSAIDAVASFVGSYSIGLLITNRVFKEGKYTIKEASIIATGFSTVSATFMIVVAKTLGLMDMWNVYFWSTLVITFVVTAITVRIYPLSKKSDEYIVDNPERQIKREGNIFANAWNEGLKAAGNSGNFIDNIRVNLIDGLKMAMGILPTILSVGLLGLILAEFTPVFDLLGYIFYPFTAILQIPEPMLAAKASALEVAEMFLPALLVTGASMITKFVIGVVSVSSILFFSASIPCILSTEIPITLPEILIIWVERTILSILIAAPLAMLLF